MYDIPKLRGLLVVDDNSTKFLNFQEALRCLDKLEIDDEKRASAYDEFASYNPDTHFMILDSYYVELGPKSSGTMVRLETCPRPIYLEDICEKENIEPSKALLALSYYKEGEAELPEVAVKVGLSQEQLCTLAGYFELDEFYDPFES
jgi:hypothetical protein